jgi:hypothetical protein
MVVTGGESPDRSDAGDIYDDAPPGVTGSLTRSSWCSRRRSLVTTPG